MKKYIDAEKLKAEIRRRIDWLNTATGDFAEGRRAEIRSLYDFIDSLQQEQQEVDMEKELDAFYGMYRDENGETHDLSDDNFCYDWKDDSNPYFKIEFARHFYELGLNARKEE